MRDLFFCSALAIGLSIATYSLAPAGDAKLVKSDEVCVAAGERFTVEVRFHAAYQNALELRVGDQLLRRFDNRFDRGADADQGPGIWRLPVFDNRTCIAVTSYHRPDGRNAWIANRPEHRANGIGFEDSIDGDFNDAEIIFDSQVPMS